MTDNTPYVNPDSAWLPACSCAPTPASRTTWPRDVRPEFEDDEVPELEAQKARTLHWMNSYNKMLDAARETQAELDGLRRRVEALCDRAQDGGATAPFVMVSALRAALDPPTLEMK